MREENEHRSKGKSIRPSPVRQFVSNDKNRRSMERKKSIENGVALPSISAKKKAYLG